MLLAAKVLVISRLLHSKLSKRPDAPPYLETIRSRLGSLRRKILTRIDGRFTKLDTSTEGLIEALCAFTLATSSTPADALRHFHHVRLQALHAHDGLDNDSVGSMSYPVKLYIKTLKATQAILPVQLSLALERIKAKPLLKHQNVSDLIELKLDVHERWLDDDLKSFTPYIRADGLHQSEAEILIQKWAKIAFSSLVDNLRSKLGSVNDPMDIASLRQSVLELWFSEHAATLGTSESLVNLRNVFNDRLLQITEVQGKLLSNVVVVIEQILQKWQTGHSEDRLSLWDGSMTSMETAHGGKAVRETILARTVGRTRAVQEVFRMYLSWRQSIEDIEKTIMHMKQTRWDIFDSYGDEDDELMDNKQILLSEDDPQELYDELKSVLEIAFTSFTESMQDISKTLHGDRNGSKAVFLVRLLRDIRLELPPMYSKSDFGLAILPLLHGTISDAVSVSPLEKCQKRIERIVQSEKPVAGRQLWEGNPEIPVICSPWAFKFLQQLTVEMTSAGIDVWSPQAVDVIKRRLLVKLASYLTISSERPHTSNGHAGETAVEFTESPAEPAVNGDPIVNGSTNGVKTSYPDGALQRLFDTLYLSRALQTKSQSQEQTMLEKVSLSLNQGLHMPPTSMDRMRRGAAEYWERTSLLFAFFA